MEEIKIEELINAEVKRISERYNKDFLECDDIIKITGLGRDSVRTLMSSKSFPITKIGRRKIVSVVAFATWFIKSARC